ncbi:MAG: glycosyltransferase [Spirochaetes bacterium]|jgi:4,4'-diaponeurosporenoate glycosyltransferase|nr:glycosyltransferase [Spirochaetota bacterium]
MLIEIVVPIAIWALAFLFIGRLREIPAATEVSGALPTVSVVVPARNEEANLPNLLKSLANQTLPPHEVIVVDDESEDLTAQVAARYGATVCHPRETEADWLGKPRACWTGAEHASGQLLAFIDADTVIEPDGLARLVGTQQGSGGLVSVQPYHAMQRPYERLSAFFNIVLMAAVRSFTILGRRIRPHGSFGPCLVCSAADYRRTGGHSLVKHEVLEDVALGRAMAERGVPLHNFAGRDAVHFRMYPGGIREVANGWTKNFARGAMTTAPFLLILIATWIAGSGLALRLAIAGPDVGPIFYVVYVAQLWWILRKIGNFSVATAVLYPIPLLFFVLVFLRSLYVTLIRKTVTWKGRSIHLHRDP